LLRIGRPATPTELFFAFLLGGLGFALGVGVFARFLGPALGAALGRIKLGPVQAEISPTLLRPGERLNCTVEFQPRGRVNFAEATAKLRAKEWVLYSVSTREIYFPPRRISTAILGSSRKLPRTEENVIYEQAVQLCSGGTATAGESVRFQANLTVPPDALQSFWASYNRRLWSVEIELRLRRWPGWTHTVPITVQP
jgi:hypothetical protein